VHTSDGLPAALEERSFSDVVGPGERVVVGGYGFGRAAEPAKQVGSDRVEQVEAAKIAGQGIHERQRHVRPVDLGHRDRAVQRHDRAWRKGQQVVVQLPDLRPVSGRRQIGRVECVAVHSVDGRLDLIGPRLGASEAPAHDRLAFGDLPSTYGPSVTSTSLPRARSTVALLGGCRPRPNTQTPAAFISSFKASRFFAIGPRTSGAGGGPSG
jgi:hypothetical protein